MKTLTHMHTINSMRYLSLSVGTEDVCVTGLFWTPLCFYFCFTHVCVVWVCVSLLCVHTTRDSVCKKKKPSIYCLTSFLHGSTWLSHFNEEYIYIYLSTGHSVCMRGDGTLSLTEPWFTHQDKNSSWSSRCTQGSVSWSNVSGLSSCLCVNRSLEKLSNLSVRILRSYLKTIFQGTATYSVAH